MLQQTRVAAVLGFYERFLQRFPTVEALASAPEQDLLTAWAGLGYYSRARNLQQAAKLIVAQGAFPKEYETLRALPGIGDYTAAAVGSIAFGLRHAVLDGNVIRVLSRLTAERGDVASGAVRARLAECAQTLLSPRRPGDFNQAMMELGATVCLPSQPLCLLCPVAEACQARKQGNQREFPVKSRKPISFEVEQRLFYVARPGELLLWQRPPDSRRMAGFWEFPQAEQIPGAQVLRVLGNFRHTIVNTNYRFQVVAATVSDPGSSCCWRLREKLNEIPLSTTSKKALRCIEI